MRLFIKSFIVGIGKIIPGVSGALLAINFNIYEKLLDVVTHFFDDWKNNLKFILIFMSGIILSIVLCSKAILFLLNNYAFITMMFFIGLISGGTYNFGRNVTYNNKNIVIMLFVIVSLVLLTLCNNNYEYSINNTFIGNIILFFGGYIDMFTSIVPGISGTSLLMILGIYDDILKIISSVLNYNFVKSNIGLYFSYGLGMGLSFIINAYIISYVLKKYRNISYVLILGLSIASIIILLLLVFKMNFNVLEFIIGIILLTIGMFLSTVLDN